MTALPTVKPFRAKRSGKCPVLAFILMAVLTPLGLWLGFLLAGLIARLIHVDFILLTVFLVWMGAIMGAASGSALGGHCRNMLAAFFAVLPATILGVLLAAGIASGSGEDLRNSVWSIFEALGIACTPWFVLNTLSKKTFCEKCGKPYDDDKTLWISGDHEPAAVMALLGGRSWDPPLAPGAKPGDKQRAVTITAHVCPGCYDAIVNVTHRTVADKDGRVVYSDFWPGEHFKKLITDLGKTSAQP